MVRRFFEIDEIFRDAISAARNVAGHPLRPPTVGSSAVASNRQDAGLLKVKAKSTVDFTFGEFSSGTQT